MEVDRVLLEEVGTHDLAHVSEGQEEFIILINCHERSGDVPVHYAHVHDLAGIHVSIDCVVVVKVRSNPDGAVEG